MNLVKSTGTFGFYTIISRLLGYLRDVLIAIFLGTSFLADVFFVAFRIPNTFRRLFAEGTFNAAFIPSYTSELVKKKIGSQKFANEIFNLLFLGLLFLVLIIEIFMPVFVRLIAPGFVDNSEKIQLAVNLTRITMPFLMFVSLSSFFAAILNSHNKFAAASAAPIILNIVLIGILFFGKFLNDELVYYLSYTVSVAGLVQFIFLIFFVRKFYVPNFNLKMKINDNIKSFFKKLLPSVFASGVTQINILVGTIIASFQASAVSYLYYADRIYQINLAIAGIAIGTVILPNLSKYVQTEDKLKISEIQNKALELSLFLSLPASFALIVASEEITSSLFGYGSFDIESVKNSAIALFYFSLGLPAFSLIKIFSSFLFARNDTNTPFKISVLSVAVNIFISVIFFNEIGFIIIPIATTISSWLNGIILMIIVINKSYFKFSSNFHFSMLKILFSNFITLSIFIYLIKFFSEYLTYENNYKFLCIIILVIITFVIYILISIVTKAFKLSDIKIKY